MPIAYRRILLKLSGEALCQGAKDGAIYNYELLNEICGKVAQLNKLGVQVAIVVGAGNIWRGKQGTDFERVRADHMGMLATTINALAIQDDLIRQNVDARVMTAVKMETFAEPYNHDRAMEHLNAGRVLVFACGTGSPYFSTDTGAALRAREIDADAVLLAKNIDGVYTADPRKDPAAKLIPSITYTEVIEKKLAVMDFTAVSFCMENKLPVLVFGLNDPENIIRICSGEKIGTVVSD